ncbi:hypothetical protein FUA23_18725 [Neolewinella aurantiaca]|uniref:Uncharacterized protein n=1 Tax=Neolewinella aurantiaca TaxID=2602767 RepID=A0A5C7FCC8_9BACT|nr:hypothetical protein [Neolewinella aurantiaca]TXF87128.1 hypothetical protein FUA23_18725 [Neolewinella aurantiaca]
MKSILFALLAVLLCTCSRPVTMGNQPKATAPETTYIIGYTGGWGGGSAYKLEAGKLYESVKERGLGNAEEIAGGEFKPFRSATGLAAMNELKTNYAPAIFAQIAPKFNCPEMAYDGVCPYFIIVENGDISAWTRSEDDSAPAFVAFMNEVEEALTKM